MPQRGLRRRQFLLPVLSAAPATVGTAVVPLSRTGGEDLSSRALLSYDGKVAAFISGMSDLVPRDCNSKVSLDDVFTATVPG